jgi:hypothetical protein
MRVTPLCWSLSYIVQQQKNMTQARRGDLVGTAINQLKNQRYFGVDNFTVNDLKRGRFSSDLIDNEERKRKRMTRGSSLGRLPGTSDMVEGVPSPIRDLFHTKSTSGLVDDGFGDVIETNRTLAVNRQVKPVNESYDALGPNELGILFKNGEFNLNTSRFPGVAVTMQCNPMVIISPGVFNYAIRRQQESMAKKYPELYRLLTPSDIWKDYSIDGIVEATTPMQHRGAIVSYGITTIDNTCLTGSTCNKLATMDSKAHQYIVNYWGSNVWPGAYLYMILKKFKSSDYSFDYGASCQNTISSLYDKKASQVLTNPLQPYQVAFLSLPKGGPIPTEHLHYYDEEQNFRTDAHVIFIGVVAEVPQGFVFNESNTPLKPFASLPSCPYAQCGTALSTGERGKIVNTSVPPNRLIRIFLDSNDGATVI